MSEATIIITELGGMCPVQGEGTIDGRPFYFRSRGDHWRLNVGGDVFGQPDWSYEERYGVWPDAGWLTYEEAHAFIHLAGRLYHAQVTMAQQPPTE